MSWNMDKAADKLMVMDCDSTLSAIEGIDELATLRGTAIQAQTEQLTRQAMAGERSIDSVFAARLDLIRPNRDECVRIGQRYIDAVEPDALGVVGQLQAAGWRVVILSGGFVPVIEPLARFLGIVDVEAVPLYFADDGSYRDYDRDYPTTRNGGKPELIQALQRQWSPRITVMVGDGVSDLETQPVVDRFIGFGRYAVRPRVQAGADRFIYALAQLPAAIDGLY